jgi:hypothetical protein
VKREREGKKKKGDEKILYNEWWPAPLGLTLWLGPSACQPYRFQTPPLWKPRSTDPEHHPIHGGQRAYIKTSVSKLANGCSRTAWRRKGDYYVEDFKKAGGEKSQRFFPLLYDFQLF